MLRKSFQINRNEDDDYCISVNLYFVLKMTKEEICPTVSAFRTYRVAHQKPVPVIEYDYYDQSK